MNRKKFSRARRIALLQKRVNAERAFAKLYPAGEPVAYTGSRTPKIYALAITRSRKLIWKRVMRQRDVASLIALGWTDVNLDGKEVHPAWAQQHLVLHLRVHGRLDTQPAYIREALAHLIMLEGA